MIDGAVVAVPPGQGLFRGLRHPGIRRHAENWTGFVQNATVNWTRTEKPGASSGCRGKLSRG